MHVNLLDRTFVTILDRGSYLIHARHHLESTVRHVQPVMIDMQKAKVEPPWFRLRRRQFHGKRKFGLDAGSQTAMPNLAEFGASINDVAVQVSRVGPYQATFSSVMAGNDETSTYHDTSEQIVCDYRLLLDKAPTDKLIITSIPYTSFCIYTYGLPTPRSRRRSEGKGAVIIYLNAKISDMENLT